MILISLQLNYICYTLLYCLFCYTFLYWLCIVYFEAAEFPIAGRSGMLYKTFKFEDSASKSHPRPQEKRKIVLVCV